MGAIIDENGQPLTWTAHYWRYHVRRMYVAESLADALAFLRNGEYEGDLSAENVTGPDGTVVVAESEIFDAVYKHGRWEDDQYETTLKAIGGAA